MSVITEDYVEQLPQIYKDILKSFFMFNPQDRVGQPVAIQSFYTVLRDKGYTLTQVRLACENMEKAGVVSISRSIFVEPTDLGKELIAVLERPKAELITVPEFPPLSK